MGFSAALSTLAFTMGEEERGFVNPQTIGKTADFPSFPGATTAAIFVGRTSPAVTSGLPSLATMDEVSGARFASSI